MTMLLESDVRTILRERLLTVSGLPPTNRRAWENRRFKPPQPADDESFVREWLTVLTESKSSTGFIEATGIVTYGVFVPVNAGTRGGEVLAKAIAEAFEAGQSLTDGSLVVTIEKTQRTPYRVDPNDEMWSFKTVTSRWRVFTPTST